MKRNKRRYTGEILEVRVQPKKNALIHVEGDDIPVYIAEVYVDEKETPVLPMVVFMEDPQGGSIGTAPMASSRITTSVFPTLSRPIGSASPSMRSLSMSSLASGL